VVDQRNKKWNLLKSFKFAFEGIFHAFYHERNMRIHGLMALIVIFFAAYLKVRAEDWVILLLLIALVISLELVNTAVERVVDLKSPDVHPLAKQAKDVAAGAVLMMSIMSVIIGVCIFIKYL